VEVLFFVYFLLIIESLQMLRKSYHFWHPVDCTGMKVLFFGYQALKLL